MDVANVADVYQRLTSAFISEEDTKIKLATSLIQNKAWGPEQGFYLSG